MRRFKFFFTTLALTALLFPMNAWSAPVSETIARSVAVNFWNTYRPQDVKTVTTLQTLSFSELQHQYVFANGEEGFVIVAADDRVRPVLGYSFDSPFPTRLHAELRFWLNGYEKQIAAVCESAATAADPRWNTLLTGEVPPTPLTLQNVPVLCATKWNQTDPYNQMCPYDSVRNDRAVVGCVATAMAQVMKYWNHPSCGTGSHTYTHLAMDYTTSYGELSADFANTTYLWQLMPNNVIISTSTEKARALATLSYHCGVAVEMMYGTHSMGGSGAYSSCGYWASACAEHAFYEYFKYDTTLRYRVRDHFSDSAWLAMIDEDLANGRPMYYDGSDSTGGHAFVLDGSNLDTCYHFNWGWGGYGNGFYAMNNLAPGSGGAGGNATYTFNYDQGAIFGIQPVPEVFDTVEVYDTICSNYTSYSMYEYTLPVAECDTHLRHLDTIFILHLRTVLSNMVTFSSNTGGFGQTESHEYCYVDGVVMPECGFTKNGYHFIGWSLQKNGTPDTLYQAGDLVYLNANITLYARWQKDSEVPIIMVENDVINLWPNPTTGVFFVSLDEGECAEILVIDASGRTLLREIRTLGTDEVVKISISDLPDGSYTVQVRTSVGVYNRRVIKQK